MNYNKEIREKKIQCQIILLMLWDGIQIFDVEKRHQKLFSQHDVKTNMAWLLYTHSDNHAIDYFANTIGTMEKKYKFINIQELSQ